MTNIFGLAMIQVFIVEIFFMFCWLEPEWLMTAGIVGGAISWLILKQLGQYRIVSKQMHQFIVTYQKALQDEQKAEQTFRTEQQKSRQKQELAKNQLLKIAR